MNVTVKLFAAARDAVGRDTIHVQLRGEPANIGQLRHALCQAYPNLAPIVSHSMFAINEEYHCDEVEIPMDTTVACIPPVSGG